MSSLFLDTITEVVELFPGAKLPWEFEAPGSLEGAPPILCETQRDTGDKQGLLYDRLSNEARALADETIAVQRAKFILYKTYPSDKHWKGLREEASFLS